MANRDGLSQHIVIHPVAGRVALEADTLELAKQAWYLSGGGKFELALAHIDGPLLPGPIVQIAQPQTMPFLDVRLSPLTTMPKLLQVSGDHSIEFRDLTDPAAPPSPLCRYPAGRAFQAAKISASRFIC